MQGRRKTQSKQLVKNVKRVTQIKFWSSFSRIREFDWLNYLGQL